MAFNPIKIGITMSAIGFLFGALFYVNEQGGLRSVIRKIEWAAEERTIERKAGLQGITERQLIEKRCFSQSEKDHAARNPLFVTNPQIETCKSTVFRDPISLIIETVLTVVLALVFGLGGAVGAFCIGSVLPIFLSYTYKWSIEWLSWVRR